MRAAMSTISTKPSRATRSIVITGAASGIGKATAQLFASRFSGYIALLDIDKSGLENVKELIARDDLSILLFAIDVTDDQQVEHTLKSAHAQMGCVDLLFNNAGIMTGLPLFPDSSTNNISRSIDLNLRAPIITTKCMIPLMRKQAEGCIINTASGAGKVPSVGDPVYSACKAGLIMFTKIMALELSGSAIRVNAVCPGVVDTPILKQNHEGGDDGREQSETTLEFLNSYNMLQPMDIAQKVLSLFLDTSANGQVPSVINQKK
jgi:NAD(P)-dependent dehydrogenase (short-subunit alcohol dehydrogenase family)